MPHFFHFPSSAFSPLPFFLPPTARTFAFALGFLLFRFFPSSPPSPHHHHLHWLGLQNRFVVFSCGFSSSSLSSSFLASLKARASCHGTWAHLQLLLKMTALTLHQQHPGRSPNHHCRNLPCRRVCGYRHARFYKIFMRCGVQAQPPKGKKHEIQSAV